MKYSFILLLTVYSVIASSQSTRSDQSAVRSNEHVFIITTDGFRWQEIFNGADSQMINDDHYVRDKSLLKQLYWDSTADLRRKRLMPFFWNVIAEQGQLYGNRSFQNKVDMRNFYWMSYPGYNELLTGYADPIPNPNLPLNNRNRNLLEFLNRQRQYNGKVVAFGSWNVFPFILNTRRNNVPLNAGYQQLNDGTDTTDQIIDKLQDEVTHTHTRYDLLTFCAAKEYISKNHPSVVFLGFGETDESAHAGRYDLYLQHATQVDRLIAELWYFVQTDPEYKDHTTFIITTDHGRGQRPGSWHTHGILTRGSGETWLACIGAGIRPMGEMRADQQIYGKQLAATVSQLLGETFAADHPIGKPIHLPPMILSADPGIKMAMTGPVK